MALVGLTSAPCRPTTARSPVELGWGSDLGLVSAAALIGINY